MGYSAKILRLQDCKQLKEKYLCLDQVSCESPFQAWMWIKPWLELISSEKNECYLAQLWEQEKLIALCLLHKTTVSRRFFFKRRIIFLNELPLADNNMVIEYNGMLVLKGYEEQAWGSMLDEICKTLHWDELHFNALSPVQAEAINQSIESGALVKKEQVLEEVFLAEFANYNGWDELAQKTLTKNKRAQLNRCRRAYEAKFDGVVNCRQAESITEALEFFDALEILHTQYWKSKGNAGAFANKKWVEFNKRIISDNFTDGKVQLYKISVGEYVIGYLYNFLWNGTVYNIQSGFNYESDNKFKPGYLSHWIVMEDCYKKGATAYNFLAGSINYKKSLCNKSEFLSSFVIRKKNETFKFLLEDCLVKCVRFVKRLMAN